MESTHGRGMKITLKAWRQAADRAGRVRDLRGAGREPRHVVSRDARPRERATHRRRQGSRSRSITVAARPNAGSCGMMVNGQAHGPGAGPATCQLHMRKFREATTSDRAVAGRRVPDRQGPDRRPDPVRRDHRGRRLHRCVDRRRGRREHDADSQAVSDRRWTPPRASDAAPVLPPARTAPGNCSPPPSSSTSTCCPRARRSAGTGTIVHGGDDGVYFGSCTNHRECEAACPKSISIDFIALMNRDYVRHNSSSAASSASRSPNPFVQIEPPGDHHLAMSANDRLAGSLVEGTRAAIRRRSWTRPAYSSPVREVRAQHRRRVDRRRVQTPPAPVEPFPRCLARHGTSRRTPPGPPTAAEEAEHLRMHDGELGLPPLPARSHLGGIRLLVDAHLAASFELEVLHRVRHVDLRAIDARVLERLVEHLARGADEGWPARSSLSPAPRRSASRRGIGGAFTEHRLRRLLVQVARGAVRGVAPQFGQQGPASFVTDRVYPGGECVIPLASPDDASSAWRRSATRSSTVSMPTDSRTSAGRPRTASRPPTRASSRRVLDQRLDRAERLREREQPVRATTSSARVLATRGVERDHAAEVAHLPRRDVVAGMVGQPG